MRSDIVDFASLARGPQIIGKHRQDAKPLGVAVVGYGYWGPNIVRNVIERPELEMRGAVRDDPDRSASSADAPRRPGRAPTSRGAGGPDGRRRLVATPPRTHYPSSSAALEAGKHVLVEKPLATTARRRAGARGAAPSAQGLVLMPGHTFLYSPPVNKVRDLIATGELGEVYFVTSSRMNLGMYQPDGVIWTSPRTTSRSCSTGSTSRSSKWRPRRRSIFQAGIPETAFITLTFAGGAPPTSRSPGWRRARCAR